MLVVMSSLGGFVESVNSMSSIFLALLLEAADFEAVGVSVRSFIALDFAAAALDCLKNGQKKLSVQYQLDQISYGFKNNLISYNHPALLQDISL